MNGSGIPLVGTSDNVTLTLNNAWTAIIAVSPTASNWPNVSGANFAALKPRQASNQKSNTTVAPPMSPSSSAITANMKSVCGAGR